MKAGLNASLELQCRETMEIRTKHLRASFEAGFEAGLEGLKPMEIEAKQYDKEGTLFWSSKRKKKQARKNGPPQYATQRENPGVGSKGEKPNNTTKKKPSTQTQSVSLKFQLLLQRTEGNNKV